MKTHHTVFVLMILSVGCVLCCTIAYAFLFSEEGDNDVIRIELDCKDSFAEKQQSYEPPSEVSATLVAAGGVDDTKAHTGNLVLWR